MDNMHDILGGGMILITGIAWVIVKVMEVKVKNKYKIKYKVKYYGK